MQKVNKKITKLYFLIFYFNFLPIFLIILIKNKPKIIWLIFYRILLVYLLILLSVPSKKIVIDVCLSTILE